KSKFFLKLQAHFTGEIPLVFIKCEANGHTIDALIDTGAQATSISADCAKKCDLHHLIDTRIRGTVIGLQKKQILGRIHLAQIKIENNFFATSFVVFELSGIKEGLILGLDFLRTHQCVIDFKRGILEIGTTRVKTMLLNKVYSSANKAFKTL
ncbi:hypothetical protein B4U79_15330, partial [Dinothrombium tinctorium]